MNWNIIVICVFICTKIEAQKIGAQPTSNEVSTSKNDGRFIAKINNISVNDPVGLMSGLDIRMQWWTLLSEPIEYYDLTWQSTGRFKVGEKTITREQLEKYPDLLKRFDNLQPFKIAIKAKGNADAGSVTVKRGALPPEHTLLDINKGAPFKKDGQAYDRYSLSGSFSYIIEDAVLLPSKAGKLGKGIVSNSPHWNHFLFWGYRNDKYYEKGKKEDAQLEKENKERFNKTQNISINAQLYQLEWPMAELKDIAARYDQYEKGVLEPSPLEEIEKRNKEVSSLTTYTKDDFWSEPEMSQKVKTEPFIGTGFSYGGYGIRNSETKETILEPSNCYIYRIENDNPKTSKKEFLTNYYRKQIDNKSNHNAYYKAWSLIDNYGKEVLNEKTINLYCKNDTIITEKVKNFLGTPTEDEVKKYRTHWSQTSSNTQKVIMQIRTYDLNLNLLTNKEITTVIKWTN